MPDLVTAVRIVPAAPPGARLRAFAEVELAGAVVVRDCKVIFGRTGRLFVSMPERKLADRCGYCSTENHYRAAFCNGCGGKLGPLTARARYTDGGRPILYSPVLFPVSEPARAAIEGPVLAAYAASVQSPEDSRGAGAATIPPDDFRERGGV